MTTNHPSANSSVAANAAANPLACCGRHPFPPARLQPAIAHTLSQTGFSHYSQHTLDVLCDLFERYLLLLASRAASHALHANRSSAKANLVDIQSALTDLNIDLESLREFVDAGWTEKLNHLDFDLRLESVPAIPIPSKHQLVFYKEAALRDDRWVLPPNFGWPLVVPCDMVLDHAEFDPMDPLFVSASSSSSMSSASGARPPTVHEGRLHAHRPPSAVDAAPTYDHTGNAFPLHIPTHLPPLPGSTTSSALATGPAVSSARTFHHLAASPTSISQHPWAPTSPTNDANKKKNTITVSGNARALASITAKTNAASSTAPDASSDTKVELDMDLVRNSLEGRQWRLPAPGESSSPTKPVASLPASLQAPPLRANPNTARHLRKRASSPPPPSATPPTAAAAAHASQQPRHQRSRPESLLGRALQAANSLSRTATAAPAAAAASDPSSSISTALTPITAPPLLPAHHAAHPGAHRLATAAHADSLYTSSGSDLAATSAGGGGGGADLDPVFPRIDLVPVHSAGPRARPIMDDMQCSGCPAGDARTTMDDGQLLVQCDKCKKWSHGKCVGVTKEAISAGTVREFWCFECRRKAVAPRGVEVKREGGGGGVGGRGGRGRKKSVGGR